MSELSSSKNASEAPRRRRVRQRQGVIEALEKARERVFAQPVEEIDVGGRLREIRNDRGLSLRGLADLSGLNVNTLSLIENSKTSPSVSTLQQLAHALQVPIGVFFETNLPVKDKVYQKFGQRPRATFAHGMLEDLGGGLTLRGGQPLLVTLQPGTNSGPGAIVHTGLEFVYCLDGKLWYQIEEDDYELEAGDSLIFEAHLPHRWGNTGNLPTRSLLILCPADENDHPTDRHFTPG